MIPKGETQMEKDLMSIARDTRYPLEAFLFVQRGLDFTVRRAHGEPPTNLEEENQQNRHVGGRDLCFGLRDFAVEEYGMLARTVLKRWNIRTSEDFGQIVFSMVEAGVMQKTDEDRIEDFHEVLDFAQAFPAEPVLNSKLSSLT